MCLMQHIIEIITVHAHKNTSSMCKSIHYGDIRLNIYMLIHFFHSDNPFKMDFGETTLKIVESSIFQQ